MAHQGGNQSSRKRGYAGVKHAAQSLDNRALAGRDFYGTTETDGPGDDDIDYGYSREPTPVPMVDQDNNGKWAEGGPGPGVTRPRTVSGSKDSMPGAGGGT